MGALDETPNHYLTNLLNPISPAAVWADEIEEIVDSIKGELNEWNYENDPYMFDSWYYYRSNT